MKKQSKKILERIVNSIFIGCELDLPRDTYKY